MTGGSWANGANWGLGAPPMATQDALVSVGLNQAVTHDTPAADTVKNLTSDGSLLISDGSITVDGQLTGTVNLAQSGSLILAGTTSNPGGLTINLSGATPVILSGNFNNTGQTLTINGYGTLLIRGTLTGGAIDLTNNAMLAGEGGTLDGVTVNGSIVMGGNYALNIKDGLTLNGTATFGDIYGAASWIFQGTQTLAGNANLDFATANSGNSLLIPQVGDTLAIGSQVTIHGVEGYIGYFNGTTSAAVGSVINQGTVDADSSGGFLVIDAPWTNTGAFEASAGGNLTLTGIGVWNSSNALTLSGNATVEFDATLTNTSGITISGSGTAYTLGAGSLPGTVNLINGATLAGEDGQSMASDAATAAEWVEQLQFTNSALDGYGAIRESLSVGSYDTNGTPLSLVDPYFADIAVADLLNTDAAGSLNLASLWIAWYTGHLDPSDPGTILNHWYTATGALPPNSSPTAPADSQDAYPATFLSMSWDYVQAGGNPGQIQQLQAQYTAIGNSILALQDADGLTRGSSTYSGEQLEDNCEVLLGLEAMEQLEETVFFNPSAAETYAQAAVRVKQGIFAQLYDPQSDLFRYVNGASTGLSELSSWYPNTVSLVWPELQRVISPTSNLAESQLAALDSYWNGSSATQLNWTDNIVDSSGYLWPSIGLAALQGRDATNGEIHTQWVAAQAFPPGVSVANVTRFTVADGGDLAASDAVMDAQTPTSQVAVLPAYSASSFVLNWSGDDDVGGAGISSYSVYYSKDGGAFQPFLTNTTSTTAVFIGQTGHRYGFYSIASDEAGHAQPTPLVAQTTTVVDAVVPTSSVLSLAAVQNTTGILVQWQGSDNLGGSGIASYNVYVETDGNFAQQWISSTSQTSATYVGLAGHSYSFYTLATDGAGNVQAAPGTLQTTQIATNAASRLVIATQPADQITAGSPFNITVKAQNALGQVDTSYSGSVTLRLGPTGILFGPLTVIASGGVAVFSGLSIQLAGADYVIQASAAGVTSASTNMFTLNPAAAHKLVVTTQPPSSATAGTNFGLVLTAYDIYGNVATGYSGTVTLALAANSRNAVLYGTITASAHAGVATFSSLQIRTAGTGYTIVGSTAGLTAATTTSIAVSAAAATHLVFTTQPPTSVRANVGFSVAVTAEDAYGNVATGYSGAVAIALLNNPGNATLQGTLSVAAQAGIATFNVSLNRQARGYTLKTTASSLTPATSRAFSVIP